MKSNQQKKKDYLLASDRLVKESQLIMPMETIQNGRERFFWSHFSKREYN
jgi:hypothetical protein